MERDSNSCAMWADVGAWNLIGWWHTLVDLWASGRPQSRLRPERLAVGQARASSVACQSLSGVTSRGVTGRIFVATVSGGLFPKIRRFIQRLVRRVA